MDDLPPHRHHRNGDVQPVGDLGGPGSPGDRDRVTREDIVAGHHAGHAPAGGLQRLGRAIDARHPTADCGVEQRCGHRAAIDARGARAVPGRAHVAQRREPPARFGGCDLLDLVRAPRTRQPDVGREHLVFPLAKRHPQQPGDRVAGRTSPARLQRGHEGPVVLARPHREREPARVILAHRLGRQDPRARVGGTTRIVAIDEGDARAGRRQLVRECGTHQAATDDGNVVSVRLAHPFSMPRASRAGPARCRRACSGPRRTPGSRRTSRNR